MTEFEKEVVQRLTKIEADLKYRISRTDRLEETFKNTEKRYWMLVFLVIAAEIGVAAIINGT